MKLKKHNKVHYTAKLTEEDYDALKVLLWENGFGHQASTWEPDYQRIFRTLSREFCDVKE